MNREEALKHFDENFVKVKTMETMLKIEQYFHLHKDNLASDFILSFKNICSEIKRMQASGEKGKIGYINYSLLRTSMKDKKLTYLIDAFDERWFLDRVECEALYEAGWLLNFLNKLEAELERKRKEYFQLISEADIEAIKLFEAGIYNQYISNLARYAAPAMMELAEYKDILKEDVLKVMVGEYMDICEVACIEDARIKKSADVKKQIMGKDDKLFWYEDLKNLDISEENYGYVNFNYTNFTGSNLSGSSMKSCWLVGAKFNKSQVKEADFSYSSIYDADFSHSDLSGSSFYKVDGSKGKVFNTKFRTRSIWGVNFEEANLENASFEGADLEGASFKGANLENVNFKGANLKDAMFSQKDSSLLELDDSQRKSIVWE